MKYVPTAVFALLLPLSAQAQSEADQCRQNMSQLMNVMFQSGVCNDGEAAEALSHRVFSWAEQHRCERFPEVTGSMEEFERQSDAMAAQINAPGFDRNGYCQAYRIGKAKLTAEFAR